VLSAPSGNELWAVFSDDVSHDLVDSYWLQSSRAISGFFGLSINLQDNPNTVTPSHAIQQLYGQKSNSKMRYASIPNEIICTENLSPWIKLLPCGKTHGLAMLFKNSKKLFESQYLSTGLRYKRSCQSTGQCLLELKQTLSLVYNSELIVANQKENTMWSLQQLFGQRINLACPVADSSRIYMDLGADGACDIKPNDKILSTTSQRQVSVFELNKILQETYEFNPTLVLKKSDFKIKPLADIHQYTAESSERSFQVKTSIKNNHHRKLSAIYFDTFPWYFRVFLSSLVIQRNNVVIPTTTVHFVPGLDRSRAHHLEIELELDPEATYLISFRVEVAFLKWDEFPPDTNHGFFINPALVSIKLPDEEPISWPQMRSERIVNYYTETLLINLPLPDFSMPYNVICLVSTAVAIAFGSLHNFTTKKFKFTESKSFKGKCLDFVKRRLLKQN
jgi:phosphatidylinositol glycan class T